LGTSSIYRVGAKPREDDEFFRVSVLGHEGRHILDWKRYGGQSNWIGEYRAKLTELLLAEETFWHRVKQFRDEAQDMPAIPHSYASYRLLNDLVGELSDEQGTVSLQTFPFEDYSRERLRSAAEVILGRSTASLETN